MFVSLYTTNPPLLSPQAINDAGAGAHVELRDSEDKVAPLAVELSPSEGLDVELSVSAGAARVRPWYWVYTGTAVTPTYGGQWVPLGGDGVAGSTGVTADATVLGGRANGRYASRTGKRWWLLVREYDSSSTAEWAKIIPACRTAPEG